MRHAVQPLRLPDDRAIAAEAILPRLVADHRHRMRIAARVLPGFESASEDRPDAQRVEVVRGHDASSRVFRAIPNAQCRPHDLVPNEGIDQLAASLKVEKIGPRKIRITGRASRRRADGDEPVLPRDHGIRPEEDSFDPAEDGRVGADSERQAEDRQK